MGIIWSNVWRSPVIADRPNQLIAVGDMVAHVLLFAGWCAEEIVTELTMQN